MIDMKIDSASATPPFEQLREALISQIIEGKLAPGTKLPAVRALATQLGLAANTVARSYKELEAAGFVQTHGRGGTTVASQLGGADQHRRALDLTRDYLMAMQAIGVPRSEVQSYLDRY
jgi:DNA-binding transcriptional regulator YhcF (GntR family)